MSPPDGHVKKLSGGDIVSVIPWSGIPQNGRLFCHLDIFYSVWSDEVTGVGG